MLSFACTPTTEQPSASQPAKDLQVAELLELEHLSNVVQVDAAGEATCALTTGGTVYCWGRFPPSKSYGEPAAPFGVATTLPVRIPGPAATRISVSRNSVAMVDAAGRLFVAGRFGNRRPRSESFEPTMVDGVKMVFKVPSTKAPLCWLDDEDTVRCTDGEQQRLPSGVFVDGRSHNCFATADSVQCRRTSTISRTLAGPCVPPRSSYRFSISGRPSALFHYKGDVCALTEGGAIECGRATSERCLSADGVPAECWKKGKRYLLPTTQLGPYTGVAVGHHGTGLGYGMRPDGTVINFETMTTVTNTGTITAITTSARHTCGLRRDGRVACWGLNEHGQLGNGETAPRSDERPVATLVLAPKAPKERHRSHVAHPVPLGQWGASDAPPLDQAALCPLLPPVVSTATAASADDISKG
ncbi:MAG: hypothetical protein KUG77_03260 [Nannocystaceae bacterium]|nr:hypothetical protein [Nannocystaceae bacterium]